MACSGLFDILNGQQRAGMRIKYYKFLLGFLLLLASSISNAQTTYYSGGSGDAANLNNWWDAPNATGSHPADFLSFDDFIIQSGHAMTVSASTWTIDCTSLTISSGGSITVSGTFNVSFSGGLDNQGSYTHNSSAAIDNDLVAGFSTMSSTSNFTIGTNQTLNGLGNKTFGNLFINTGVTVASNRTFLMAGNLTLTGTAILNMTGTGSAAFSSLGGFVSQSGSGTLNIASTAATPIPAAMSWAGTVVYNSNSSQTIVSGNYTNLTSSGSGARTLSTSTIGIAGTFTPGSNSYTVTSSTIEYNGTTTQNVAGFTYNNLTISNTGGTLSATGNLVVNAALAVNSSAVLNMGTNTLTGTLSSTSGSGTIRTQHTATSTPLAASKTWSPIIEYNNASGGQTVVGGTYGTLVISNTSSSNTAGAAIAATSLTLNTGSVLDMTTFSLTGLGGTISGTGTLNTQNTTSTPIPSAKTWTGTVVYNSSSPQTIILGTYNSLTASGGDRTLDPSGNVSISGTFTPGSGTYTTTNSMVVFNASGSQSIPGITPSYHDLTVSNTGTKSLSSDVTIEGTLTLPSSSDFLAINGNTLTLEGSTALTGFLKGSSTSNITVSGSASGSPTVKFNAAASDSLINTFTLNKTAGSAGVTLGSNVAITRFLTITTGAFDINGHVVTLQSTSIANTAQVTEVTGTIDYGTGGSFTVERYIPNSPHNNRAFRDIAPGVNTASGVNFFHTWQENGSSPAGYGTHITGLAGVSPGGVDATTGLDITQTGNVSMYQYINGVYTSVTNTKTTKPNVYQAYRVTIRGDRNTNLYQTPQPTTLSSATALRASGEIVTGTVTYTTSGVAGTLASGVGIHTGNADGNFSLLGNPYVCAIDWNALSRTNLYNIYWVFDATIGTAGAYVTWDGATNSNGSSNIDQYIQPGQGFFIQTFAPSPQLVIQESNKVPGSTLTDVFRNQNTNTVNKLSIGLSKFVSGRGTLNMDGTVAVFNATDNNNVDAADASKIINNTENIAVFRSGKRMSIEHRNLPTITDTIPLRIWQVTNGGSYSLVVDSRKFSTGLSAYVIDKYLSTETPVKANDTTNISFTVNTADTASHINRFSIVFRGSVVPLNTINLKAATKNNGVEVEWKTTNEVNLSKYEVEKSFDGVSFSKIGTKNALNGTVNNYEVFDPAPQMGHNYYRIKIVGLDNSVQYSKTVLINLADSKNQITIYPNPVKGSSLSLQLNLPKGNYSIDLVNSGAQKILSQSLLHNGGIATQVIDWRNRKIASGGYVVLITSSNGVKISKPITIIE
jgi:hypothetical protein